jgi:hypothetical protein
MWSWLSFENVTASRARFLAAHFALEGLLIVVGYELYSLIADHAPRNAARAMSRTASVLRAERVVHLSPERSLNTWWAAAHTREVIGNLYYDGAHFLVTALVLVLVLVLRPSRYRMYRDVLLVMSLLALAMFWLFPVGPPRLLQGGGFVDTIARVQTLGAGGEHGMTSAENPFAAMPSLHVGWALWVALSTRALTDNRALRALAWCYPALTTFVVMATGNHMLADGAAAVLLLGVSTALVRAYPRARRAVSRSWARTAHRRRELAATLRRLLPDHDGHDSRGLTPGG